MRIKLTGTGKRYNREWIFRHLDIELTPGAWAITGPNGSGKSTLLQVIAGATTYNEGVIEYFLEGRPVENEKVFTCFGIAAPYLELVEEMKLQEFLNFHANLRPWLPSLGTEKIISLISLENAAQKQIRYFSSGMKQRVKLAQAIFSHVPCVMLDEPLTNLDAEGVELYHRLIKEYTGNRLLIISSNDPQEYDFCDRVIDIRNYKQGLTA